MIDPVEILGPQGRIAARLQHYEERPQQLEMADAVAAAIEARQASDRRSRHRRGQKFRLSRCRPFLPPPPSRHPPTMKTKRSSPAPPNRRQHAHHRPAGTVGAQRYSALEVGHAQRVHRRAGQRARQLPQPAAAESGARSRKKPVHRRRGNRATSRIGTLGQSKRPTARWPICHSARSTPSGTKSPATAATAWAATAPPTTAAFTIRRAAAPAAHKFWSSITRCSSAIWPCAAPAPASCPITTSSSSTKPTPSNPSPAITWAWASRRARSNTRSTSSTTTAPTAACWSTTNLATAQQEVERCRVRADDFFADINRWLDDQTGDNGRVHQARDRAEPAQPGAGKTCSLSPPARRKTQRRQENASISPRPPIACEAWPPKSTPGSSRNCPRRCIGSSASNRAAATHASCCAPPRSTSAPPCASNCSTKCPPSS